MSQFLKQAQEGKGSFKGGYEGKASYLSTKDVDAYNAVVEVVSADIREHDPQSPNAGKEFFLLQLRLISGTLFAQGKGEAPTKMVPGEKCSYMVRMYPGKGAKRALEEVVELVACLSGKRASILSENVMEVAELVEDSDRYAGLRLHVVSKKSETAWKNPLFTRIEDQGTADEATDEIPF